VVDQSGHAARSSEQVGRIGHQSDAQTMGSATPAGVGSVFPARAPREGHTGRSGDGKSPRGEVIRDGVFADVVKADGPHDW